MKPDPSTAIRRTSLSRPERHLPAVRSPWRGWAIPTSFRCGSARAISSRPNSSATPPSRRSTTARPSIAATRGILPLREAIRDFHKRTVGADVARRAHLGAGRGDAGRGDRAAMPGRDRRQCRRRLADLAQHLPGRARWSARKSASRGWTTTGSIAGALAPRSRQAVRAMRRAHQGDLRLLAGQSDRLGDDARRAARGARLRARARHRHHQRRGLRHAGLSTAATHAPSFLEIAEPDDNLFVDQQLLQALGDDGLAHRLAGASRAASTQQMKRHHASPTTPGRRASRNMARSPRCRRKAMRSAPRCSSAAAAGRDVVQNFIDGQNRIRWMRPGRRVLRLPARSTA